MKIVKNTSAVDTRELRRVITACKNGIFKYEGKPSSRHWKALNVTVHGKSDPWTSGHAYINGSRMHLSLPNSTTYREAVHLAWHELMHIIGYKSHRDGICDPTSKDIEATCKRLGVDPGAKVPHKPPKAKRKPGDLKRERYARLLERRKAWNSKLKRATNALKKIERDIKRYERDFAKS